MFEEEKEIIVCLACMAPNSESENLCQHCGALLRTASSLDPLQTIRDEGALLRKATSMRPKFVVVLGTWILFMPWVGGALALDINIIFNWQGFSSLVFFWLGVALFLVGLDILATVTKNYLTPPEKTDAAG